MPTITLSIPEEMKKEMEGFKIINWSAVAREAISEKMKKLAFLKEFASESELTEKEAIELGRKLKQGRSDELKRHGLV